MARHPSMEFAPEPPADPRPAWERIAYAWLAREVDGGQPVTAAQLASETSVTPAYARDLLRVLRAQRDRDPDLTELRARLVRDRISDLYLTRELRGGERLDPAQVAGELGTTATVTRQWLRALREVRARDPRLASLRATPASHGRIHADQLAALAERFRAGAPAPTSPAPGRPLPADALTDQIELAWRRAQVTGKRIDPAQLARELRTSRQSVTNTLTALRAGAPTTRQRIEAAYTAREVEHGEWVNLTDLAAELGTSPAYVKRVVGPLRATHRASQRQPAPPPTGPGEGRVWLDLAACRDTDPELFFAERGEQAKAQAAKQVCAACPVQGPCRDLAVVAAASRGDDHGIFGGTKPHERTALRDNPARRPSSWLTDRAAAAPAGQLPIGAAGRLAAVRPRHARPCPADPHPPGRPPGHSRAGRPAGCDVPGAQPGRGAHTCPFGRRAVHPHPRRRTVRHGRRRGSDPDGHREPLDAAKHPGVGDHPPGRARPNPRTPTRPPQRAPPRRAGRPGRAGPAPPPSPGPGGAGGGSRWTLAKTTADSPWPHAASKPYADIDI